ncbi:hypothetical protein CHKEEEPN_1641 [Methylorubrum podarium]|nr:hypothetical protein CHKEEEPN_1641 [Methylorubrum podarium]
MLCIVGDGAGSRPAIASLAGTGSAPFTRSRRGAEFSAPGKSRTTRLPSLSSTSPLLLALKSKAVRLRFGSRPPSLAAWLEATSFTLALIVARSDANTSSAPVPVTSAAVVPPGVVSATISAEAARAIRLVEMMPPMLAVPAVATLFCVAAEGFLTLLSTRRFTSALMSSASVCSGVLLAMVLLTVALTVPALAAVT